MPHHNLFEGRTWLRSLLLLLCGATTAAVPMTRADEHNRVGALSLGPANHSTVHTSFGQFLRRWQHGAERGSASVHAGAVHGNDVHHGHPTEVPLARATSSEEQPAGSADDDGARLGSPGVAPLAGRSSEHSFAALAHASKVMLSDAVSASKTEKEWAVLIAASAALISLELLCLDRLLSNDLLRHSLRLGMWLALAMGYCWLVKCWDGWDSACMWLDGYLLDWALSFDNLFAFHLVISYFRVPRIQQQKAIVYGMMGAVVGRLVFYEMFNLVFQMLAWCQPICGIFLVYTARCTLHDDEDLKVSEIALVRKVKRIMGARLDASYDLQGGGLFRWTSDGVRVTPLLLVVVVLWIVDVIFAVDSVSAKVVGIPSQFLACSSSMVALLGMGAVYPLLHKVMESVSLLKYAVAAILFFLGIQLILSPWVTIPASHSLAVIGFFIAAALVGSAPWSACHG